MCSWSVASLEELVRGRCAGLKAHVSRKPSRLHAPSLEEADDHHDHQNHQENVNQVPADVEGHPTSPTEEENENENDEQEIRHR